MNVEKIKYLEKKYGQKKLAEKMGVSTRFIRYLKTGKRVSKPMTKKVRTLYKTARSYDERKKLLHGIPPISRKQQKKGKLEDGTVTKNWKFSLSSCGTGYYDFYGAFIVRFPSNNKYAGVIKEDDDEIDENENIISQQMLYFCFTKATGEILTLKGFVSKYDSLVNLGLQHFTNEGAISVDLQYIFRSGKVL